MEVGNKVLLLHTLETTIFRLAVEKYFLNMAKQSIDSLAYGLIQYFKYFQEVVENSE